MRDHKIWALFFLCRIQSVITMCQSKDPRKTSLYWTALLQNALSLHMKCSLYVIVGLAECTWQHLVSYCQFWYNEDCHIRAKNPLIHHAHKFVGVIFSCLKAGLVRLHCQVSYVWWRQDSNRSALLSSRSSASVWLDPEKSDLVRIDKQCWDDARSSCTYRAYTLLSS